MESSEEHALVITVASHAWLWAYFVIGSLCKHSLYSKPSLFYHWVQIIHFYNDYDDQRNGFVVDMFICLECCWNKPKGFSTGGLWMLVNGNGYVRFTMPFLGDRWVVLIR